MQKKFLNFKGLIKLQFFLKLQKNKNKVKKN